MAKLVILGAGVMGSALAVPAAQSRDNQVILVGSPLDDEIIASVGATRHHPTLNTTLPDSIEVVTEAALNDADLRDADVIVIGVSSPGIDWVTSRLQTAAAQPPILALVTKGLVAAGASAPPQTYADALPATLTQPAGGLVGIGGPCIARELALGLPTCVTFASRQPANAERLRESLQTDTYRITTHHDIVGVEACAALKNFLCIGVSAMFSSYPLEQSHAKNPVAGLFNQAILELALLSDWLRAHAVTQPVADGARSMNVAFDLAGMGDLHVTVGGGRNSRLGRHLGEGQALSTVVNGPMQGVTVEGVDTGRHLSAGFRAACANGDLDSASFPLTFAILNCIDNDELFEFDFQSLYTATTNR